MPVPRRAITARPAARASRAAMPKASSFAGARNTAESAYSSLISGRLTRPEIRELYADSAVFLAPAELEAFGIAALEARAAGLAVIARRGSGIEEFVSDEIDGLIVSGDDAMADAVVRLVRDRALLT